MDEYIEKRKVVNLLIELENEFQQFKPFKGFEHAMYRKLCEAEIAIGKLPAADVVPGVHGRWVHDGPWFGGDTDWYYCSSCGCSESGVYAAKPYCSNCGAKMDGKEATNG